MVTLNQIVSLAKRRGFVFQSSEIYGGQGGCWDYGPLGVELKNNIKKSWWKAMTHRKNIVGIDAAIIMHPQVWKASGHVDGFSDPLVDCKKCKSRFRADNIDLQKPCIQCGEQDFTEVRDFNLMFKTQVGSVVGQGNEAYLRPETAQGIFVNFLNVQSTMRMKLPMGIAQIGKSFRNEITPGNFIFRTREFEQMEMQYFVTPGAQKEAFAEWKEERLRWHMDNGLSEDALRIHPHDENNLAHYADAALDIEFNFPMGFSELEGVHSRTDFDLKQHAEHSGKNLYYVDQENQNKKYLPYVIETAVGLDRCFLAILCSAHTEDEENKRDYLNFHPHLAPVKMAILPLQKKEGIEKIANQIYDNFSRTFSCQYDHAGSIGKRYRRQDEIGTPYCVTVDFESLEDSRVTIRERNTMKQERVHLDQLDAFFSAKKLD